MLPMRSTLVRRMVRLLAEHPHPDLARLAADIVQDEERRGHSQVARELRTILAQASNETSRPLLSLPRPDSLEPAGAGPAFGTLIHPENLRRDMVLSAAVESRFRRIEDEYQRRDQLARYGLTPRRRILLHGPPGCGKSLGAERLAANLALPLYRIHFDAVVSSFLGQTASNLRRVFTAPTDQPRLLLLDECDFIASARTGRSDVAEMARTVNTLLDLVERFDGPGLLVATTNLYDQLDPALFRRFDDVLAIARPGAEEIERLLRQSLAGIPVDKKLRWAEIARDLDGSSASRIVRIGAEAAKGYVLGGLRQQVDATVLASVASEIPLDGPKGDG